MSIIYACLHIVRSVCCPKILDISNANLIKNIFCLTAVTAIRSASNTPFTRSKNYLDSNLDHKLDCNPDDISLYMGRSLFNTTKCITLLFIVHSLLQRNPPNIWIRVIQIVIQIECLHRTKLLERSG